MSQDFDPVYYRLLWMEDKQKVTVVGLQHFDEYGVSKERYLTDSEDRLHRFDTEDEAIAFINANIKKKYIDSEYLMVTVIKEDDKRNFRELYKGQ